MTGGQVIDVANFTVFTVLSNSLFINYPIIRRYIV
jgi:hypothetical protein